MKIVKTSNEKIIAKLNEPVQNLHHKLYPKKFKAFNYKEVCEYFGKIIDKDNQKFYVCYDKNDPVGYIWFSEIIKSQTAFSNHSHYLYIQQVSVNESHQGKGIGKELFDIVLKYAHKKSIKRVGLDYWIKNTTAKKIYKKIGFKLEKEITYINL